MSRTWYLLRRFDLFKLSFLFLAFATLGAHADQADSAFTEFSKLVDVAYPASKLGVRHRLPSVEEKAFIDDLKQKLIPVLEATAQSWVATAAGKSKWSDAEQKRLFRILEQAPIWICKERCMGCNGSYGCADGKYVAGSVVSYIKIESCALGVGSCPHVRPKQSPETARVISALVKSFSQIASWSITGISTADLEFPKRVQAAIKQVDENYLAIKNIHASCPDRFSGDAFVFVDREKLVEQIGIPAIRKCVDTAISMVRSFVAHPACMSLMKKGFFKTEFEDCLFKQPVPMMRATRLGEWVLCNEKRDARFIKFGSKWFALVPEGSCEGESNQKPLDFILSALSGISRSDVGREDIEKCLTSLTK